MNDAINPNHYRNGNNVQIIEVIRYLPFSIANAIKYVYRNERKENAIQDLHKAIWYINDFKKHPVISEFNINDYTHKDLIDITLADTGEWEKECSLKIIDFYNSFKKANDYPESIIEKNKVITVDFETTYYDCIVFIENRIMRLENS